MNQFVLGDEDSKLEIDLVRWDGDAYISVLIDSKGYSGAKRINKVFRPAGIVSAAFGVFIVYGAEKGA